MHIHVRRPSDADLDRLLARCKDDDLTYTGVGGSLDGTTPEGLTRHHWRTTLPAGTDFALAVDALSHWRVQQRSGLVVRSDGPLAVGTNVAMTAPLPLAGHIDVTCRVVAVVDEPDRFGFAYGTLSVHAQQGEESFVVSRRGGGLQFDVTAISRPASILIRLAGPIADRLQESAAQRYLRAMERLTLDS